MLLWQPFAVQAAVRYFERGSLETDRYLWRKLRLPTNGERKKKVVIYSFWSNFSLFIPPELMGEEREATQMPFQ